MRINDGGRAPDPMGGRAFILLAVWLAKSLSHSQPKPFLFAYLYLNSTLSFFVRLSCYYDKYQQVGFGKPPSKSRQKVVVL